MLWCPHVIPRKGMSMEPGTYNFKMYRGDTKRFQMALKTGPDADNLAPIDLTGATVTSQIRQTADASEVAGAFTCTIDDAIGGLITLEMLPAVTATLTKGAKVWDVQVAYSPTEVLTYVKGTVTVDEDVTRA